MAPKTDPPRLRSARAGHRGRRIKGASKCAYRHLVGARYDAGSHDGSGPKAEMDRDGAVRFSRT